LEFSTPLVRWPTTGRFTQPHEIAEREVSGHFT
jgi:hypothetical protein